MESDGHSYVDGQGRVFVPVDLRRDVVQPLNRLERGQEKLGELVRTHIETHGTVHGENHEAITEARRARVRVVGFRILKYGDSAIAVLVSGFLGVRAA